MGKLRLRFKGDSATAGGGGSGAACRKSTRNPSKKTNDNGPRKTSGRRNVDKGDADSDSIPKPVDGDSEDDSSMPPWIRAKGPEYLVGPLSIAFPDSDVPSVLACECEDGVLSFVSQRTKYETNSDFELYFAPGNVESVFIARKSLSVASSEAGTPSKYTFKSTSGKYISSSKDGQVSCFREAVGPTEEWNPVYMGDTGTFAFESAFGTYLSIVNPISSKKGDQDENGPEKAVKPRNVNSWEVTCYATTIKFAQRFSVFVQSQSVKHLFKPNKGEGGCSSESTLESILTKQKSADVNKTMEIAREVYGSDSSARNALRDAAKQGRISEVLLDLRSKGKSDRYCK